MSRGLKITLAILFVLVFLSLGLNLFLIQQLFQIRQQTVQMVQDIEPVIKEAFNTVDAELADFQESSLEFNIQVNQDIPLQTNIPFEESLKIPVQVTIPVKEQIETTVMMDPFQSGFEIPVDISVPLDMEFPIDQVVPISIDRTIPVSTSIPLSLTVPINININDTDLVPLLEQLRNGLNNLEQTVNKTLVTLK